MTLRLPFHAPSLKPGDRVRAVESCIGGQGVTGRFIEWNYRVGGGALVDLDDGRRKWCHDVEVE